MKKYRHWDGSILFVKRLAAGDFCIFSVNPQSGKEEKVSHKMLPITQDEPSAQKNLDLYAASRCLEKLPQEKVS